MGAWVGTTKLDPKRGSGIMINHEYVPGEKVLPSDEEVKKLRPELNLAPSPRPLPIRESGESPLPSGRGGEGAPCPSSSSSC